MVDRIHIIYGETHGDAPWSESRTRSMASLFVRQFTALFWKNWIVLAKHPWLNILRCFVLPIAYGIFLAVAQVFLNRPNSYGVGSFIPVYNLSQTFDGSLTLVWADGTNGTTGFVTPDDIMSHITRGFSAKQLRAIKKVDSPDDIAAACPQNFNLYSECYAAVAFDFIPPLNNSQSLSVNYTLRGDGGLYHVDVKRHRGDFELRILPLQWAVDQAIIELRTGRQTTTPLEWPFTQMTNEEEDRDIRLSYINGILNLLVLAFFICYIGIVYQLPGSVMGERAIMLTSHLKAMGLLDSARIISWHASISLVYLPAWIIVSLIWHFKVFSSTSAGLVFLIHLLLGLSLASWSLFVGMPFGKSPQLAAVASTFFAIVFAIIAMVMGAVGTGVAFIFSIIFPPGFYIFAIRIIGGFEVNQIPTNALKNDPKSHMMLLPLIIAAIACINIFLWPWLAVLVEHYLYDAREPQSRSSWRCWGRKRQGSEESSPEIPSHVAISIRNLEKKFRSGFFKRSNVVTAIADLSIDIPKYGIFVLLGSNGAGKSTALSILAGLLGRTSGSVLYEGGVTQPPRGAIGIVPQKNVLFPELTCYQTLCVWRAVKWSENALAGDEDLERLLRDCDLGNKIHSNASTLSGGQKRKLQLAIGLVGGSKIVLVDECTSGVDPLSRRALWRTLISVRHDRTIVFTTHFLDEADFLADNIAVLSTPGKLVAIGSPVTLKTSLGEGYTVHVRFNDRDSDSKVSMSPSDLLRKLHVLAPSTSTSSSSPSQISYHLKSKDSITVVKVLQLLELERDTFGIASFDIQGTTIEDIFLRLMDTDPELTAEKDKGNVEKMEEELLASITAYEPSTTLQLTDGRKTSPLEQALTIFHKRVYVARRSWLTPFILVVVAVLASGIPLFFMKNRVQSCRTTFSTSPILPLYLPDSSFSTFTINPGSDSNLFVSPPNLLSTLGSSTDLILVEGIPDNVSFVNTIGENFRNISTGGISVDLQTGQALLAWESSPPGNIGPVMLNLVDNILYNLALNNSGNRASNVSLISADYQSFPAIDTGTLVALKWIAFFGAAMAVYPAFFSLYVSRERHSSVQAMQFSNGLSNPVGLWLGHLLFDSIFIILASTIIIIVFAAASDQFHGLGFFWFILVLYGISAALFSYCFSLATASPLAAFAACVGYQVIIFILYLAGYLLTLTYAKTSKAGWTLTVIHFTVSLASPVVSIMRTAFISVNMFSLLCRGGGAISTSAYSDITRYGGPILYLILYSCVLFAILVRVDSGSILPRKLSILGNRGHPLSNDRVDSVDGIKTDVKDEIGAAVASLHEPLRVLGISKSFGRDNKVVDNLSLGVHRDTIFALLGPNGAGKTTAFNVIRGDILPDQGDVLLNDISVVHHPRSARLALGVCPQFTAIDSQMTVREHLQIYGRLKGLKRGELESNVTALTKATGLELYADRLASKLSGGNQRKLSLAIALMGNPSVVLIDEFSTGIDAKMKREMWITLRKLAIGKAIIITTHSMEEASALAQKVGIIAKHMLAVGTTESLATQHAAYEVHIPCRSRDDVRRAQELMTRIPGARLAEDVATRFEVPIENDRTDASRKLSLAQLFHTLSSQGDFAEFTVEKATLENVFLKVIRENEVSEEDFRSNMKWWRHC
ncbi:hypothetical protein EW146_g2403 [Bondarzewia mesenterica]|uniref:ABC transporter domain-containing protein n=1 Tax=Bondarzewia mesenterica TaxID=1095465 RepID=A0A4S4M102_9AGAM|nr:hypothetical protein EW146_g2403 [Bondarzewia mesenterica]